MKTFQRVQKFRAPTTENEKCEPSRDENTHCPKEATKQIGLTIPPFSMMQHSSSPSQYQPLQRTQNGEDLKSAFTVFENIQKCELVLVAVAWLVGCPLLALLHKTNTMYGQPDEHMCGLLSYSISASMTGDWPKLWGTLLVPFFSILVVQRSSNGLCALLKLGWLRQFTRVLKPTQSGSIAGDRTASTTSTHRLDQKTIQITAKRLWVRIVSIESLGYLAGAFLVALVVFDARDFMWTHIAFSTLAFTCLTVQNKLVGGLGKTFPEYFHGWSNQTAERLLNLGLAHSTLLNLLMFGVFGTLHHFDRCDGVQTRIQSTSQKMFGDESTLNWLISVIVWYNEYAFGFLCLYVQLLVHWFDRLWDYCGTENMPLAAILPRFSLLMSLWNLSAGLILGRERPPVLDLLMAGSSEESHPFKSKRC